MGGYRGGVVQLMEVALDKLCIILNDDKSVFAWSEPYVVDGEYIPSITKEHEDGTPYKTYIIDKSSIPQGVKMEDCKYIDGQLVLCQELVNERELSNLRSERAQELSKYDKFQLPYLQSNMSEKQLQEYDTWRQAWLDVTETRIKPKKPDWFDTL